MRRKEKEIYRISLCPCAAGAILASGRGAPSRAAVLLVDNDL